MPDVYFHSIKKRQLASMLVAAIASTVVNFSVIFPSLGQIESKLGVIRSADNSADWIKITTRIWESGIGIYKPINLEDIKSAADLADVSVLFLPNIETLNAVQVKAIEEWVKKGGKLIAAGPVGRNSPALVRQSLRSLLGGYWAFPLTQSATPQPRLRCRDIACKVSTNWVPPEATNNTVKGGVLIPADINSQTVAIWKQSDGSSAVIASDRATYFGWNWGKEESGELDNIWLKAALARWNGTTNLPPNVATTQPGNNSRGRAPVPAPNTPNPNSTIPNSITLNSAPPSSLNEPVPENFTDPSEQSAPAGLDIQANSNKPISSIEIYLMRQELTNLLGRVESALIAVNSANITINLNAANLFPQLVAANNNIGAGVASRPPVIQGAAVSAIAQAKQVLQNFDRLISKQNYAAAREQWLQARQLLWQNYPTEGQRIGAEIRAVWLDRGSIVKAGSEQGLAAIFDRLAQAGINTVFFETLNAGYPIYPSQIAPQQNPLTLGWDPLESAVKLAHERGIELHAWIWTFATGNKRHNALLGLANDYPGPVLSAHPDWANIDNKGRRQHVNDGKFYLDPANQEARSYLLRIIGEITSKYKVDGLQLDYIRYPFQDPNQGFSFGYGKAAREQFKQQTGVDPAKISPDSGDLWPRWIEFKTEKINSFVAEVSQFLRQNYPRTIISVAVFPHPESQRIYKIQQNWEVWARRGDIDLVVPMTYALDTNRLQRIAEPLAKEQNLGSTLIAPSVKLLNLPNIVAIDQIQALRDLPMGGYSIFAFETIGNNLQTFFSRTQGHSHSVKEPIPYRQPFAAAAVRYTTLKQEWSLLLATNQLRISESELTNLSTEANDLAQALTALAANPSAEKLAIAKRFLQSFKSRFQNSMRLHSMENSYQVETWENRLASLDMLLRYGERVELNRR
ncbi:hypothetical protein BCD67_12450 [Oscillatoriales cyanobacterium USR001]|nr:hypothetical protein BCD67_12450 [Oscillatoriales cyanobacterium USR001]